MLKNVCNILYIKNTHTPTFTHAIDTTRLIQCFHTHGSEYLHEVAYTHIQICKDHRIPLITAINKLITGKYERQVVKINKQQRKDFGPVRYGGHNQGSWDNSLECQAFAGLEN